MHGLQSTKIEEKTISYLASHHQESTASLSKWQEVELEQLCKIHHGYAFKSEDFADSGPIVLTPGNFTEDGFLDFENKRVVRLGGEYESKWELLNGSLLVVMTDLSQQKKILGATVILDSPELILHNQRIGLIEIFSTDIEPHFLRYAMMSGAFRRYVSDSASGTMVQHTSPTKLQNGRIQLAPKNEQTRIVTAIESLQQRSARARTLLSDVRPKLDNLRQSILQAAFSGRLTAEWRAKNPDVEPADVLLDRIRTERRQRWEAAELAKYEAKDKKPPKNWQDKYKEPEPVDDSELPELPELPEGWCWAFFEEVASIDSNLQSPNDYPDFPHIAPDNIERETGRLLEYRTIREDRVTSNKNRFFKGQIVYSKIRPYLSKLIIAEFDGLCSADMYPISTNLKTNYLYRYMLSNFFLDAVQEEAGNRVVLPKVNQKQLYDVPVPVAPIIEQTEIVRVVERALGSLEQTIQTVIVLTSELNLLDQSILSKAFRGELVPQDPNDEPASELLARIRASREAEATAKKATKKKAGSKKKAKLARGNDGK